MDAKRAALFLIVLIVVFWTLGQLATRLS